MPNERKRSKHLRPPVLAVALVLVVSIGGIQTTVQSTATGCTVDDKDRSIGYKNRTSYRVYSNCGVLEVSDNIFIGKFDSADRYAAIKVGSTYDFKTVGWRAPLLSQFPNIVEAIKR